MAVPTRPGATQTGDNSAGGPSEPEGRNVTLPRLIHFQRKRGRIGDATSSWRARHFGLTDVRRCRSRRGRRRASRRRGRVAAIGWRGGHRPAFRSVPQRASPGHAQVHDDPVDDTSAACINSVCTTSITAGHSRTSGRWCFRATTSATPCLSSNSSSLMRSAGTAVSRSSRALTPPSTRPRSSARPMTLTPSFRRVHHHRHPRSGIDLRRGLHAARGGLRLDVQRRVWRHQPRLHLAGRHGLLGPPGPDPGIMDDEWDSDGPDGRR